MPLVSFAGEIALVLTLSAACGVLPPFAASGAREVTIVASDPTLMGFVDPGDVDGLDIGTIAGRAPHTHISYPVFADASRLNAALRASLSRLGTGEPAADEVNVGWRLTAVTDDVIGVRLLVGERRGDRWTTTYRTVWYDRRTATVHDSAGLLRDRAALAALAGLVKATAAAQGEDIDPAAIEPDPTLFASMAFNFSGDLVVEFGDGLVAPRLMGRMAVAVPAGDAGPLLSEFGRRAQAAAREAARAAREMAQEVQEAAREAAQAAREAVWPPADGQREPPSPPAAGTHGPPVDCGKADCLALTFDDGPGAATGRLLDTLAKHGAHATFFTVGENVAARPDLVDRMRAEGHLVGNHTWSHRDLTALPQDKVTAQLSRCQRAVAGATGATPAMMRAPYGAADGKVSAAARGLGLAIVGWDVDPHDETKRDPAAIARAVIEQVGRLAKGGTPGDARRGAIVLLHDTNAATVAAMPRVLSELGERGYTFVTVPELYGSVRLSPGRTYDSTDATRS